MTVVVHIQGELDTERLTGDLVGLVNNLNIAVAAGKQYALLDTENGPIMIQARLITKAREEDADAFIGRS